MSLENLLAAEARPAGSMKSVADILHLSYLLRRSCVTCEYFDQKNEMCKMVSQRPPARVVAFGCEKYEQEIPF
jgi:hypothetical protein